MSSYLWPHGLQHIRLPRPSLSPRVCSNSCPLSWCHHILSSPSPPALSLSQHQGLFQWVNSGSQSTGALASVLPINIQSWFPLGLTGLISLLSRGLSRVFQHHSSKASILWCSAFFLVQLSHLCMITGKTIALNRWTFVMSLLFNMLFRFVIAFLPRSKWLFLAAITNCNVFGF